MNKTTQGILQLTDPGLPASRRQYALREFAVENDWLPSDQIDEYPGTESFSNGHLVVEHGLDNTAVISFLKNDHPFQHLNLDEKLRLISISYNNLVDWHLLPDRHGMTVIYNRTKPFSVNFVSNSELENVWRAEAFDKIVGRKPNPNIKSLDDALIQTVSFWKRVLASEPGNNVKNENISSLFNAIIFARALEDDKKHRTLNSNGESLLLDTWRKGKVKTIRSCLNKAIRLASDASTQKKLIKEDSLKVFDNLNNETVDELLNDFYRNKYAPYQYDFSLMSKHALSRIYEHYVSLFREEESKQMTFFPDLPEEINSHEVGAVYTPQFIARFFARYLKENMTPAVFRSMKFADPSCGSGIFLRTVLEMQCDPLQEFDMREPTTQAFKNVLGVDVDENACQATRLSLYLLHLVLRGDFPSEININQKDAIQYFRENNISRAYDAIITNPPFVKWDKLSQSQRDNLSDFMRKYGKGKLDLYLALLKLGMEATMPGGYLLYVLPHSFLRSQNANAIRKEISDNFFIRFIGDLSEISVFENVGAYVILLILQRKDATFRIEQKTTIVRCRENPGKALQVALEGKAESTDMYEVFKVNQSVFDDEQWNILPPKQMDIKSKVGRLQTLDHFLIIKEGFITGADDIFLRKSSEIPKDEKELYIPYLSDRNMEKYEVPSRTNEYVFYPYLGEEKLTESELKNHYPKTWKYLQSHSKKLKSRKSTDRVPWWSPVWPRPPKNMLVPKIISPHLVLFPKFSLDLSGKYGVSRCPLMYPRITEGGVDLLYYFLGILNSSVVFWQIANLSDKYSRGYFMLEPKTLKKIHVPDPSIVPASTLNTIKHLIQEQINNPSQNNEQRIDQIVADLYGLSEEEQIHIGMGNLNGID